MSGDDLARAIRALLRRSRELELKELLYQQLHPKNREPECQDATIEEIVSGPTDSLIIGPFRYSEDFATVWRSDPDLQFDLTSRQASVFQALCNAHKHALTNDHIMTKVLGNIHGQGRLRDTFKSKPGYLGKEGDENALIVKVEGPRPVLYRLNS